MSLTTAAARRDLAFHLHPATNLRQVQTDGPLVITRGEGTRVWDADGREYLDATASLWCVNVGHGRQEIADAVAVQMSRLASYSAFGAFANEPAITLAERIADYADGVVDDPRVFFGLGGGDAIDTAAKLARRYFAACGEPDRDHADAGSGPS